MSRITPAEFHAKVIAPVPFVAQLETELLALEDGFLRLRLPWRELYQRPGNTVAGPVMMALADIIMYGLVMSRVGEVPMAVTTHLNCTFLRKPGPVALIAEGRLVRLGRTLAFGDILLSAEGSADPCFQASCTYALPR
jgi:uncharacterized protein (TIGR00369 family)